jgi:hypothetical protein
MFKHLFYIILAIIAVSFVMANLSLLKSTDTNIPVGVSIKDLTKPPMNLDLSQQVINALEQRGQKIKQASDQIQKQFMFKLKEKESVKEGAELTQLAPELEKFEDYAPVDAVAKPVPLDKNIIALSQTKEKVPDGLSDKTSFSPSEFDSDFRSPWSEKKGKDDLSYFFNTHAFDKSFDDQLRTPVECPTKWEKGNQLFKK